MLFRCLNQPKTLISLSLFSTFVTTAGGRVLMIIAIIIKRSSTTQLPPTNDHRRSFIINIIIFIWMSLILSRKNTIIITIIYMHSHSLRVLCTTQNPRRIAANRRGIRERAAYFQSLSLALYKTQYSSDLYVVPY